MYFPLRSNTATRVYSEGFLVSVLFSSAVERVGRVVGRTCRFGVVPCKSTRRGSVSSTEATKQRLKSAGKGGLILIVGVEIRTPYGPIENECSERTTIF